MATARHTLDPVANQAIDWMVLLRSGTATACEQAQFEGWRRADPRHEAACQRIERVLGGMGSCAVDVASRKALLKPAPRKRAMGSLCPPARSQIDLDQAS